MNRKTIISIAIVGLLVITALWGVSKYNGLVNNDEAVSGQWANVEININVVPTLFQTL
mgnify:CR=1 FL=1